MKVPLHPSVENLLREHGPSVLGAMMRRFGDFAAAEDAVQEALLAGAIQWPRDGLPDHPRGWLIQVASRNLSDKLRSEHARRRREADFVAKTNTDEPPDMIDMDDNNQDDTLKLLFMCCHPSLSSSSAIALTLRAVGGLTTDEIANAFLIPVATMAQRITRAKNRIQDSGIPFSMPTVREQGERLDTVLHVLYLVFNEGYTRSSGPYLQHSDLSNEAIRLTRTLHHILPQECEVAGLLALMLLTDARRTARTGSRGELISLVDQDRTLWDRTLIAEGIALISEALSRGIIGAYQLQAAIAAVHDEANHVADTDWPQILALYGLLKRMSDNPMVALNHAIAAAMVKGPDTGLKLLANLDSDDRLAGHYRLESVRGHLFEMSGDHQTAIKHYLTAANLTTSIPERDYLHNRAARLVAEQT